jgi:DNA-binding beta-propeller fold protein YncE
LRASDGTLLDTITVETTPTAITFDSANLWVTSFQVHGRGIQVRTNNPDRFKSYKVGKFPIDVIFDGQDIWLSNRESNTVSKITLDRRGGLNFGYKDLTKK